MQTTFYDYGKGTNSERFIVPYIRRLNNSEMTMNEIFSLKKGANVLYQGVPSQVLRTTADFKNNRLEGAKRVISVGLKKSASTRKNKSRKSKTRKH